MTHSFYQPQITGSDQSIGSLNLYAHKFSLPGINCSECGEQDARSSGWMPSWKLTPAIRPFVTKPADDPDLTCVDLETFQKIIAPCFAEDTRSVLPGTFIGNEPVEVPLRAGMSVLAARHLKSKQPLIGAGFADLVCEPMAEALAMDSCAKLSAVELISKGISATYYVPELQPIPLYSEQERLTLKLTHCEFCGTNVYGVRKGTYRVKQFTAAIVSDAPKVFRCRENDSLVINEKMRELVARAEPRIEFRKCGEVEA